MLFRFNQKIVWVQERPVHVIHLVPGTLPLFCCRAGAHDQQLVFFFYWSTIPSIKLLFKNFVGNHKLHIETGVANDFNTSSTFWFNKALTCATSGPVFLILYCSCRTWVWLQVLLRRFPFFYDCGSLSQTHSTALPFKLIHDCFNFARRVPFWLTLCLLFRIRCFHLAWFIVGYLFGFF